MKKNCGKKYEGQIYETKNYGDIEVIEYISPRNIRIRFLNTGYEDKVTFGEITKNSPKDYLQPVVYGIGFLGAKMKLKSKNVKAYGTWTNMLKRCYCVKFHKNNQTYIGTTVCKEWHNFQNFCVWFDDNYIEGYELDKDLLQDDVDNKIYSPETCVFLPRKINSFFNNKRIDNKSGYIGVCWDKFRNKYRVTTSCFETKKQIFVGRFYNIEEANKAYVEARMKQAEFAKRYMRKLGYWSEYVIQKVR